MKRCTTTTKLKTLLMIQQNAIHCVLRPKVYLVSFFDLSLEKTLPFDDLKHFSEEEKIVAYVKFFCGFSLYPEFPKKANRSTENGKKFQNWQKSQVHEKFAVSFTTSVTLYLSQ